MTCHAPSPPRWERASLVTVWLGTAMVSALTHRTQGEALLRAAGLSDAALIQGLIWGARRPTWPSAWRCGAFLAGAATRRRWRSWG